MSKPFRDGAVLSIILFTLLSALCIVSAGHDRTLLYAKLIWSFTVSVLGFFIFYSGNISRYRSILFILIAFFFFLEFKFFRFISLSDTIAPYCHIAQAPTLLNFIYSQYLALVSGDWKVWGVLTLGFLWLSMIFTIGPGICSWVCFYGGIDEMFSKALKKPFYKIKISKPWRDFPMAFLIFLLVVSFLQGLPFFCNWFCPFKMTEAFWDSHSATRAVQAALFWSALAGFVIILPVLTKKRTFCSMVCPFGALASVCGTMSAYRAIIDGAKCIRCGRCQDVCPVFAVEDKDRKEYKISNFCNRCGTCIDICPVSAINIFTKHGSRRIPTRNIFIFMALLITGALSGSFVPRVLLQLAGVR